MRSIAVLAGLLAALWTAPPNTAQTVEGALHGGGRVTVGRDGQVLEVAVTGPRAGLASLCVSDGSRIRILHASAAAGEAVYESDGTVARLRSGFEWKLRDAPGAPPAPSAIQAFFDAHGWSADTSRAGAPERRFRIRLDGAMLSLAVTYYTTDAPQAVSYWPESLDDDCRAVKIAQGYLPETATFRPGTWHAVKR